MNILSTSKQALVSNSNTLHLKNMENKPELKLCKSTKTDTLTFTSKNKLKKFEALPTEEKQKICNLINYLCEDQPLFLLTYMDRKPYYISGAIPIDILNTLIEHKDLFNTKKVKIFTEIQTIKDNSYGFISIVNIPETEKKIKKHLEYFKYRLQNDNLTTDIVMQKILTGNTSKLFEDREDLLGIILGFPFGDCLLYQLSVFTEKTYDFLKSNKKPIQNKIAIAVMDTIRPDLGFKEKNGKKIYFTKPKATNKNNLPYPDFEIYNSSELFLDNYRFINWNKKDPEVNKIKKDCIKGLNEVRKIFANKDTILTYILKQP